MADSAADYESDRNSAKRRREPREPSRKRKTCREREHDQADTSKRALLRQEPIADALVPDEHEIEEGRDGDNALGADVVDIEHPRLVDLIDERGGSGNAEPERRHRTP